MRQHLSSATSLANAFRIPFRQTTPSSSSLLLNRTCKDALGMSPILSSLGGVSGSSGSRLFSTSSPLSAKGGKAKIDKRITLIRYFLYHPLTPRPLRFSRNRYLRHWTIHRAWQLHQAKLRKAHEVELEKQWQSMRAACEELRTGAGDGGKLFRVSMNKRGVFNRPVPIEYGRLQMETPSKDGWNYDWTP
ncbi:hypothetical protein VTO42DRAFT_4774 [Malbranchea cinnamomea]